MSIIKNIAKKVVQIVGVVRASAPSGEKRVDLDIQIQTDNSFEIGRRGLRIDAPNYALADCADAATGEAVPVNAAYRSEGHGITLMSEAARQSSSGHKGPLVFTILPDLERQERAASPKDPVGGNKKQDLADRGRPADDETLTSLKSARLLYIYKLSMVLKALYKWSKPKRSSEDAKLHAFKHAGLAMSAEAHKKGSTFETQNEKACQSYLLPRTERRICRRWRDEGDSERLLLRAGELIDALRLIGKAIVAYELLARGKRHVAQESREGKVPSDGWVAKEMLGSPEKQKSVALTYVEKMQLCLYTGVNASQIWPDTVHLGDGAPETDLFHGATLVAALGAGRQVKATAMELRPLAAALLSLPRAIAERPDGVRAKSQALANVYAMLGSIAEMSALQAMLSAIVKKDGVITITPMDVEPLLPLSSLQTKGEGGVFTILGGPVESLDVSSARQVDDIYWAREFWRPAKIDKKSK